MPVLAESIGSGDSGSLSIGMSSASAAVKDDGDSAALPQKPDSRPIRAQQHGASSAAQPASEVEEVQPGSRRSARAAAKQKTRAHAAALTSLQHKKL